MHHTAFCADPLLFHREPKTAGFGFSGTGSHAAQRRGALTEPRIARFFAVSTANKAHHAAMPNSTFFESPKDTYGVWGHTPHFKNQKPQVFGPPPLFLTRKGQRVHRLPDRPPALPSALRGWRDKTGVSMGPPVLSRQGPPRKRSMRIRSHAGVPSGCLIRKCRAAWRAPCNPRLVLRRPLRFPA
jgi:hypothetical protein